MDKYYNIYNVYVLYKYSKNDIWPNKYIINLLSVMQLNC